ncbi:MAG TPA: geranylgeranyl reductase family protein [Methanomassiliicoccales archaeon]|nr:geranylgeranyl reductase family protein [Methanomassiliicoccales archaeon]
MVGAGPAGSTAAEHAALAGASVLLLEKRPIIGVPVRCGEFLPHVDEVKGIFPDAKEIEPLFDLPSSLNLLNTTEIRIYSPRMRASDIPFQGFTTDRAAFDGHLAERARKAGATVLVGTKAIGLEGTTVITDKGRYQSRVVVGADGPLSMVAKSVGFERSWDLCPAHSALDPRDFDPVPEMYFGAVSPGGYAWVIPKTHGANVGLGVSRRYAKKSLKGYYDDFVKLRKLVPGPPNGKMVPMSGPIGQTVKGNVLVVGDAAGQVMPVNGGGIPIALICGRIAGVSAANAVNGKADLAEYETEWRRQVGGPLGTAVRTKRLAMMTFGSQWRLEWAMRMMGKRRMGKAIRCQSIFP